MSTNETYGVTNDEIMDYLKNFIPTKDEMRLEIRSEINLLEVRMDEKLRGLEVRMDEKIGKLRSDIIDHIDKKILELKTDLVTLMRSEDRKLCALVELLVTKSLLTPVEASGIIRLEPFPRGV